MANAPTHRWAAGWVTLTAAFALHVVDEATHDFLDWYNPAVLTLREQLGWFPMPTFDQGVWLAGLIGALVILFALTPAVARGRRWIVPVAYIYACVHIVNGLGHLAISASTRQWIPGVLSSPFLFAAAVWLFIETGRARRLASSASQADRPRV
ncbi:MAG: HXXEE domain-containing protein [Gemmatimonadales bacterium]|nr:HXXEE domain-containing protein [Gemmatimonadales bacterium]